MARFPATVRVRQNVINGNLRCVILEKTLYSCFVLNDDDDDDDDDGEKRMMTVLKFVTHIL